MFYEQLEKLCKEHNTTPTAVIELLGMSKGTMSNWKKGGTPNSDAVVRFAKHFNVSTDYLLLGFTKKNLINADETELLNLYNQLPHDIQRECIGIIKGYVLAQGKEMPMESELQRRKA